MASFRTFILERINAVEIRLQKVENDVLEVVDLYDSFIASFEKSPNEFDQFFIKRYHIIILISLLKISIYG